MFTGQVALSESSIPPIIMDYHHVSKFHWLFEIITPHCQILSDPKQTSSTTAKLKGDCSRSANSEGDGAIWSRR